MDQILEKLILAHIKGSLMKNKNKNVDIAQNFLGSL
jgi:hypothetical protein